TSDVEEGLRWDMISQVGALLKSAAPSRPLADLSVEHVYLTTQDAGHQTYIHAIQPHTTLASGGPVYDGHLTKSANRAARIRRCAAAPANGDPRNLTKNAGVPVINVLQENDVLGRLAVRRPDSDEPVDRYRLYEVPGTAHSGDAPYRWSTATMDDHVAVGGQVGTRRFSAAIAPFTLAAPLKEPGRCRPSEMISEQPLLSYIFHSSFANLDRWVRQGTPPPRAGRMEVANAGTSEARLVVDEFGNGVGGVRTPYVDVPTATYHAEHGENPGCGGNFGYSEPFDWARLDAVYGSYENYASRLNDALNRAVAERWLTETDAQKIRRTPVRPGGTGGN
ncbi:MAG: alpha/beta hydrolase domain-containing protein, partial [Acidobacteria bacterium]|nr:alpha/beta hydrolase domain-containing protein [Acidobacteriota bacterium]